MHLNVASMVALLSFLICRRASRGLALVVDKLLVLVEKSFLEFVIGLWVLRVGLGLP